MRQTSLSVWLKRPKPEEEAVEAVEPVAKRQRSGESVLPTIIASKDIEVEIVKTITPRTLPDLPPQVRVESFSKEHVRAFRSMNSILLPVNYGDSFYKKTLSDSTVQQLTRVALWTELLDSHRDIARMRSQPQEVSQSTPPPQLVAAIRCDILRPAKGQASENEPILYITTLGTLAPYRRHALATYLLEDVIQFAVKTFHVTKVGVHVWEANEEALIWYQNRGFKISRKEEQYYRNLVPTAAWVLQRTLYPPNETQADSRP